jgi:hypothetical protein
MNSSAIVDLLPTGLWAAGNLYLVFGRQVHLCFGDGVRTVEVDGREVARGRRPVDPGSGEVSGPLAEVLGTADFGWITVVALSGAVALLAVRAGLTRMHGKG